MVVAGPCWKKGCLKAANGLSYSQRSDGLVSDGLVNLLKNVNIVAHLKRLTALIIVIAGKKCLTQRVLNTYEYHGFQIYICKKKLNIEFMYPYALVSSVFFLFNICI